MRHKFYFGLLLIFFSLNTNLFAQNFWVPDANFRLTLKQNYPSCFTAQDSLIPNCTQIQNEISLDVSNLSISSLAGIQYFTALDILDCSYNQLSSLPALPASLTQLYCNNNLLMALPPLPPMLTHLGCYGDQLSSLPPLPTSLIFIDCGFNQLSSLPALPASLKSMSCLHNQLTSLPALPDSLTLLFCHINQLSILPALPQSLINLNCALNHLSSLPALPGYLEELVCGGNQLTSLPALPSSLTELDCSLNQLTSLPRIPGKITHLLCHLNPISCFPEIAPRLPGSSSWSIILIDSTLISCIPNLGTFPLTVIYSSQTLPLCTPSTTSCNYSYTYGYVFGDVNGNGIKEIAEKGIVSPVYYAGNSTVFPDSLGFFNASSDTGNISFEVALPMYYSATSPSTQTIQVVNSLVDTLYFGLQPIPNINDLKIDLTSIGFLRPGFKVKYQLHYQNVGTETLNNVQVKFLKPSQLSNLSAIPSFNSLSGDTLIWNITTINPNQQGTMVITDSILAIAGLGANATAYAWIEPLAGDTTPYNNISLSKNFIRGSCDPNDKSVTPQLVLPNALSDLEYTMRFQNTGTDTAFTVTIIDTLATLLDLSSMQMINASHAYKLSVANRIAKWVFKNILLPDSNTNELESHGFVKFRIKPLTGLTVTDSIPNKADIYFDYNAAVSTNTIVVNVINPLQVQDLKETELQIFPNPVKDILRIVNQHTGALGKIELINGSGKVLEIKTISTSTFTWNLQHLPAGTYVLKGQGWGQKVVKE